MKQIEEIEIPQCTVSEDEILLLDRGQKLSFYDNHIRFKSAGQWEVTSEKTGMKEKKEFYNVLTYGRGYTGKIECFYNTDSKNWATCLGAITIIFEDKVKAFHLLQKLIDWNYSD